MGSSPEQQRRPPRVWISKPMQVFTIGFLGVCYIAAEISQGKARALLFSMGGTLLLFAAVVYVAKRHQSRPVVGGVHRYPSWYWSFGYIFSIFPVAMLALGTFNYLHGVIVLQNLLIVYGVFGALLAVALWGSARNRKIYGDVIAGEAGLTATVKASGRLYGKMHPGMSVPWRDVERMEQFRPWDKDALTIGAHGPGVRVMLKDGKRILILPAITGFNELVQKIDARLRSR